MRLSLPWNKWSCKLYLEGKVQLIHFYKTPDNITRPLFQDTNNGAASVPEFETSLAVPGEWPGFLLVGLKVADKTGGEKSKKKEFFFSKIN